MIWKPGSRSQVLAAMIWKLGAGCQDLLARMWQLESDSKNYKQKEPLNPKGNEQIKTFKYT